MNVLYWNARDVLLKELQLILHFILKELIRKPVIVLNDEIIKSIINFLLEEGSVPNTTRFLLLHGFKLGSEKHTTEAIVKKSGALQLTCGIEGLSVLKGCWQ